MDLVRRLERALADRYQIEGRLGAGSTAVVFLARDLRHHRQVALKVLRPDFAESLGSERFLREIRLVASFTHPRILPLYDSGNADGLLWYSMPLARGGSLRTLLSKQSPMPVADAIRIALQTAAALDYAHQKGVIHRDIKPENLLIEDGEVLLTDFGLARTGNAATDVGTTDPGLAVGTPIYMSPEQAAGLKSDARADIYALACVLYEMLDGEPPFSGRTAQAVLARHRTEAPRDLAADRPEITVQLKGVLRRGLAKLPADRYATAGAFAEALRAAVPDAQADASGATMLDERRLLPWWRRPETLATAGVSLALGIGLALFGEGGVSAIAGPPRSLAPSDALMPEPQNDPRRIAVLYLQNISPEALPAVAVDGITEEVIDELSRVDVLSVSSMNAVRPYRGELPAVRDVSRKLAVRTVVEGTAAMLGDSVRVSLRLLDGLDETKERALAVTVPQAAIAGLSGRIVAVLADELRRLYGPAIMLDGDRVRTPSADAWKLLQAGHHLIEPAGVAVRAGRLPVAALTYARAESLLRAASRTDSTWGDPYVERALLRLEQALPTVTDLTLPRELADSLTAEAVRLLDGAAVRQADAGKIAELRGHAAWIRWQSLGEGAAMSQAEAAFRRATALRPGMARGWLWLSEIYHASNRMPEASVAARHALDADAWLAEAPFLYDRLITSAMELDRFGEAAEWCRAARRRFPDHPSLAQCHLQLAARSAMGDSTVADLWRGIAELEAHDRNTAMQESAAARRLWVAAVLARSGRVDSARRVAARALDPLSPADRLRQGLHEAYLDLQFGDVDASLEVLQRYVDAYPQARNEVAQTTRFRALQSNHRFRQLVQIPE